MIFISGLDSISLLSIHTNPMEARYKYYNQAHLKVQKDDRAWHVVEAVALGALLILATGFVAFISLQFQS